MVILFLLMFFIELAPCCGWLCGGTSRRKSTVYRYKPSSAAARMLSSVKTQDFRNYPNPSAVRQLRDEARTAMSNPVIDPIPTPAPAWHRLFSRQA